jgi:ABC-type phosphate transport system permease subunit
MLKETRTKAAVITLAIVLFLVMEVFFSAHLAWWISNSSPEYTVGGFVVSAVLGNMVIFLWVAVAGLILAGIYHLYETVYEYLDKKSRPK